MPKTAYKYKTDEERHEARKKQKRDWAKKYRVPPTYREIILLDSMVT